MPQCWADRGTLRNAERATSRFSLNYKICLDGWLKAIWKCLWPPLWPSSVFLKQISSQLIAKNNLEASKAVCRETSTRTKSQGILEHKQLIEQRQSWSLERPAALKVIPGGVRLRRRWGWSLTSFTRGFVSDTSLLDLCEVTVNINIYFLGILLEIQENGGKHKQSSKMSGKEKAFDKGWWRPLLVCMLQLVCVCWVPVWGQQPHVGRGVNRTQAANQGHGKGACGQGICEEWWPRLILHLAFHISECLKLLPGPKKMEALLEQAG